MGKNKTTIQTNNPKADYETNKDLLNDLDEIAEKKRPKNENKNTND